MNEQITKDIKAESDDKNEAAKLINAIQKVPEDKRQIVAAIASAYIDGMEVQKILDDKVSE